MCVINMMKTDKNTFVVTASGKAAAAQDHRKKHPIVAGVKLMSALPSSCLI